MSQKITRFTPATLDSVKSDINQALKSIAEKYGIELKTGNLSYSDTTFTTKIEAAIQVEGVTHAKEAQDFKKYAVMIGLSPTDLGREFSTPTGTWKLVGMQPRKQKTPMLCQKVTDGKLYLLSEEVVVKALTQVNSKAS